MIAIMSHMERAGQGATVIVHVRGASPAVRAVVFTAWMVGKLCLVAMGGALMAIGAVAGMVGALKAPLMEAGRAALEALED